MAETFILLICVFICQSLLMIFRGPKCKTIKSCFSQISLNKDAHATRDTRQCEICNHIWERPYISIDSGGGGGG